MDGWMPVFFFQDILLQPCLLRLSAAVKHLVLISTGSSATLRSNVYASCTGGQSDASLSRRPAGPMASALSTVT